MIIFSDRVATAIPVLFDTSQDHPPFYIIFRDAPTGTVVYRVDVNQLAILAS